MLSFTEKWLIAVVSIIASVRLLSTKGAQNVPTEDHHQHRESEKQRPGKSPPRGVGWHHDVLAVSLVDDWLAKLVHMLDSWPLWNEMRGVRIALIGGERRLVTAGRVAHVLGQRSSSRLPLYCYYKARSVAKRQSRPVFGGCWDGTGL